MIIKKRKKKKSRLQITGNDRAIMKICQAGRKLWFYYGENRTKTTEPCVKCKKIPTQADHIKPLGSRPRQLNFEFLAWFQHLFFGRCEALCKTHHKQKTDRERQRRNK